MAGSTSCLFLGVLPTAHPDELWTLTLMLSRAMSLFKEEAFLLSAVHTCRSRESPGKLLNILVWDLPKTSQWVELRRDILADSAGRK